MSKRYSITFVIEPDVEIENIGVQPWYVILGDEPMPVEWLEYVAIRQLEDKEMSVTDITPTDAYNVVDLTYEAQLDQKELEVLERRSKFKLVVDNGDIKLESKDGQDTKDKPDSEDTSGE